MSKFGIFHANLHRSSTALLNALMICRNFGDKWVLSLNEIPLQGLEACVENNECCWINGLVAIITSTRDWSLIAAPQSFDICSISGHHYGRRIGFLSAYWRPWKDKTGSIFEIINEIRNRAFQGHTVFVAGDFNTENTLWSLNKSRTASLKVIDMLGMFNSIVFNIPNKFNWTRSDPTKGSTTWIDIIAGPEKLMPFSSHEILDICNSDHRLVQVVIEFKHYSPPSSKNNVNFRALEALFKSNPLVLEPVFDHESVNTNLDKIYAYCSNQVSRCFCEANYLPKNRGKKLISRKRYLQRKIYRLKGKNFPDATKLSILEREYQNINRSINYRRLKIARQFTTKILHNELDAWQIARKILGNDWHRIKQCIYGKSFESLEKSKSDFEEQFGDVHTQYISDYLIGVQTFNKLTEDEWRSIISKLKRKSCLYDRYFSGKIFMLLFETNPHIRNFIESCLYSSLVPKRAFNSNIVLIEKQGGLKYRPIAVMNPIGRMFDCAIHTILMRYASLSTFDFQHGFTKGKGSDSFFITLFNQLAPLFTKDLYLQLLVTIDVENAFENFSIDICCKKLLERTKNPHLCQLIKVILMNRYSKMKINDKWQFKNYTKGSFQGGFMSPLLFNVATEDVHVSKIGGFEVTTIKYADDVTIVSKAIRIFTKASIPIIIKIFEDLANDVIETISTQCLSVGLNINREKSRYYILSSKGSHQNLGLPTGSTKIMGLEFASGCIKTQLSKCMKQKIDIIENIFKRKSYVLSGLPPKIIPIIYDSMLNSILRYFSLPMYLTMKRDYVRFHCNSVLRMITATGHKSGLLISKRALMIRDPIEVIEHHLINVGRKYRVSKSNITDSKLE
ncbi:uncharacterized protein LOC141851402 [Brevipalpus obovatus]|uniref:uncharacterized protein LOC141851402 n=1 Tax=Brevipalpus obovatus TaxID=246614 RepID=UPI003D9E38A4